VPETLMTVALRMSPTTTTIAITISISDTRDVLSNARVINRHQRRRRASGFVIL
jgi:hypothetical protein